jgi:hypothetical protein
VASAHEQQDVDAVKGAVERARRIEVPQSNVEPQRIPLTGLRKVTGDRDDVFRATALPSSTRMT